MQERYQIILDTKNKALASLEELKKQIEILNYKESFYGNLIASKATFDPWNPNNAKKLREAQNDICGSQLHELPQKVSNS